jgi:hypothetical protein
MVLRLLCGVGGERPHAQAGVRFGVAGARAIVAPVERKRLLGAGPFREEPGEGVGQAEVGRDLGAVV